MKYRFLSVCLAVLLVFALSCNGVECFAQRQDAADDFALQFLKGVQSGKSSVSITCDATDAQAVCNEAFRRYPVLYHYYDGMTYTNYKTYTKMDVSLYNQQDSVTDIPVITSEEEMLALVCSGLSRLQPELKFIATNGFYLTEDCMSRITETIRLKYPLSYMGYQGWVSNYIYSDEVDVRDYSVKFQWFYDLDLTTLNQWRQQTEQAALRIAETEFALDMPDELKILRIHDYLVNHNRYNSKNMDQPGNHLAYGALVRGSCVCQGYSEACLVLCQAAGLEAVYVPGDGIDDQGVRDSHGWNAVKLNGEWYMLDITWDDPVGDVDTLRYDYFLVTNQVLKKDHIWQQNDYPICTATTLNAQKVLDFAKNDRNRYTQYTNELLVTMAEADAQCQQILRNCEPKLPGEPTGPDDSQIEQPTQPVTRPTQPDQETQPATRPTQPDQETQPATWPSQPDQETKPTFPITTTPGVSSGQAPNGPEAGTVIGIVSGVVSFGAAVAALLVVKKKKTKKKQSRKVETKRPVPRGFDDL